MIELRGLTKCYGGIEVLKGIDLAIQSGEALGLVGESGCGKSTLGRCLLRLVEPSSGKVFVEGEDFTAVKSRELKRWRRKMQIVFQDPYSSLNPKLSVGTALREPLSVHGLVKGRKAQDTRVGELLEAVGLPSSASRKFPHEFSGGQRQRIVIARALAVEPSFIVCDEPVSALDVSIQAQILELLKELKERYRLTYLFISHDLRVVRHLCDRVAVMYFGQIVELGRTESIFSSPEHSYTRALLAAIPRDVPRARNASIKNH